MDQERARILRKSLALFFRSGYSRVTTQEIAESLGISKKTLYRHFSSKKEIALAALSANLDGVGRRLDSMLEREENDFGRRFVIFMSLLNRQVRSMGTLFIEDFTRSLPEGWEMVDTFRREKVFDFLRRFLTEGRENGFVRTELDQEELIFLLTDFINQVMVPERVLDAGFSLRQVFSTLVELLLGGILTRGGYEKVAGKGGKMELEEIDGWKNFFID